MFYQTKHTLGVNILVLLKYKTNKELLMAGSNILMILFHYFQLKYVLSSVAKINYENFQKSNKNN